MDELASLLLVDDNARNLDALETILAAPDLRLVRAVNADEALMALVNQDFAAIVLDVQMPEVDGLELAEMIKARKKTRHVPILFLTAHYHEDRDILRGYGAGAVDYLTKPINPDILRSKVSVFVDLFRKTRALAALNLAMESEIRQRQRAEEDLRRAKEELERRVAERTASLTQSLGEKEVLLREIHHRVKNNMQVVSSLLSLQAAGLPKPLAAPLRETQGRIRAMALVHEKLYQSANLAQVDMAAYTRSLLQPILHTYSAIATRVRLRQKIAPLPLAIDIAIPCGLILNELVTNALKHAFPEDVSGEITVELCADAFSGRLDLRVSDNGVGLPKGFEERESPSLGLRLVRMLTAQLQGRLEVRRGPGAEFRITFPAPADISPPNNSNNQVI